MNKLKEDLPARLEELCQFTFNFNNLMKVIDYLHHNNLSLQLELQDMDKRLLSMEFLKNDIEDLKIKTTNIERTNDNINRSLSNLQERFLNYDSKMSEIQAKTNENESNLKKFEIMKNDHEQNLNHLNKVVEDNVKTSNKLNELMKSNNKNLSMISEKLDDLEKKDKNEFENVHKDLLQINSNYENEHKEIENINNTIGEMNETINNIMTNFEKKHSDMNTRVLDLLNDVADINNILTNNNNNNKYSKPINKYGREVNPTVINAINKDMGNTNYFKIIMDEFEEEKNKLMKLKEDYELNKDKQKKDNEFYMKSINQIKDDYENIKQEVEDNTKNIENNYNYFNDLWNEEKEKQKQDNENKKKIGDIDIIQFKNYLSNFAPLDNVKKLSDNVRIINSTLNSKPGREEVENQIKKLNQRLEKVEMAQLGQTHGPRPRINLGLVNLPFNNLDSNQMNAEDLNELNEVDYFAKIIEKKINSNLINTINKEIKNIDLSGNPKFNELINNYNKNCEDIDKNNKTIIDIRNILVSSPTQKDFINLKMDVEKMEEDVRTNKLKIIELTKDLEGSNEEEDDPQNALPGTMKDKINFLNKTCQTLNLKIIAIENKNKSITKEVKDDIKQNLKTETVKIMQQFKLRLESFTNKFEHELKNKIDQIGLSDFENKINNKFHIDLKEKLDKNDLKKNNNIIKRKIDNLETKISKTLVDTIIDLQMDDQPLIIKKNGNGADVCASCNQPLSRNFNFYGTDVLTSNIGNMNLSRVKNSNKSYANFTQSNIKSTNISSERNLNSNISLGQSKLPDIISPHPK